MRPALIRDIETRSTIDVGDVGAHIYASHPTTEILCVGYCLDDKPVKTWHPDESVPLEFKHAFRDQSYVAVAHNAAFERQIEQHILGPKYGFPIFPVERNVCTMAMSLALALPGGLERIAKVLNLTHTKDIIGRRAMLQVSKPRRARKQEDPTRTHWYDDAERLLRLDQYCIDDVETTREIFDSIPELSEREYQVWLLDQKINDHGIYLDERLMLAAKKIVETALPSFDRELTQLTNGRVTAITQVTKLKEWISRFYSVNTLRKDDLDDLLDRNDLPKQVRRALELRAQGAHAAVKKIDALLNRRNGNGRICGAFVYHAAGPGRWSSRGAQLQNMKRSMTEDVNKAISIISTGSYIRAKKEYKNPLSVIGDLIRATITAAPGNTLIGADFSGIEARVTAWVAGEVKKLDAFRAFDAGTGPDPYIIAAAAVLGIDAIGLNERYKAGDPVAREQRQVGKACELAFGYQGGVNAFKRFMPSSSLISAGPAQANWDKRHGVGPAGGERDAAIEEDFTDVQIDNIKRRWRQAHPNIAQLWDMLAQAAWRVVKDHSLQLTLFDRFAFECDDQPIMWITLPSGRKLAYPHARVGNFYKHPSGLVIESLKKNMWSARTAVGFKDASAGQWRDVIIYGGFLTENIVQAISRDILAEAMLRIDRAGFTIVAHIHDECVIEVAKKNMEQSKQRFSRLMNTVPAWAKDLPIKANAWTADRYVK
jgi:DNA polymerase